MMIRVLILTQKDDCHGPMAAAFLRDFSTDMEVISAGLIPEDRLDPLMVQSMKECLVNFDNVKPRLFDGDALLFDFVICINLHPEGIGFNPHRLLELNSQPQASRLEDYRIIRDYLKNELFVIYRDVLRKL